MAKKLAQLKLDAKRKGWPWKIDHPNDERALLDGCYPDFAAADRVRRFYRAFMVLPKPGGGTRPFTMLDWWFRDVMAPLFGWKRKDGRRRFDKAFVSTAKKSAKSTILAGLPLYMILADGEDEAEAYVAAVDRDQASIIYRKTSRAVQESEALSGILRRIDSQKRIEHEKSSSYFEAISSDADSAEGKNPHLLLVDELHVWRDRQFFNALMYSDIAREQPLFAMITTAGDDVQSVGYEEYEYAKALLSPADDLYSMSHFAFIAEAAPERDWDDPQGWQEANPSIGQGYRLPTLEKLQAKCDEAKQTPRKQREFIRYICNRWTGSVEAPWLDGEAWQRCMELSQSDHIGEPCWGGLDLSRTRDLTALSLVWRDGDCYDAAWWFWMPKDSVRTFEDEWRVPLRDWVEAGWITATPGAVVDYTYIRKAISGVSVGQEGVTKDDDCLVEKYDVQEIGYDPYNASKLVTELHDNDGVQMVEVPQGYQQINQPAKLLENLVAAGLLRAEANPVAKWMASHCVVDEGPTGNIKPSKKKSRQKIDGITSLVIALSRAMVARPPRKVRIRSIG